MNNVGPINDFIEFRREVLQKSIPERFEEQVAKYRDRVVVRSESQEITYDEMNKRANRLARVILEQLGEGKECIALLLGNDCPMITVIVGILKAGKIYMSLSPSLPPERNAYMLADSQAKIIVTNSKNLSLAQEIAQDTVQVINFDEIDSRVSNKNLSLSISPENLAYLLYTSGSTGQPKGVTGRHNGIIHEIMFYTNAIHICSEDRQALVIDASVSGSIRGIFGTILNGASVCLYNLNEKGIENLADWMIREEVTIYSSVATTYRQIINSLNENHRFPKLRLIHIGGETVYKRDVELYKKHFSPDCILLVGLGITETGSVRHHFINKETQISENMVPVGYAVTDMEVLLLDDDGKRIGFNQIGEIAVRSRYVSPGYWRRPDLTQARFLPDPEGGDERIYLTGDIGLMMPDGLLMHMGRKDFQVKIRGNRVEIPEIEMALLNLDAIEEAAVVAREDQSSNTQLVAYLVPDRQPAPTITKLRRALAEILPDYMIPSAFVIMDELPLTATGKINRLALPEPDTTRPELDVDFVAPRDKLETEIAAIWKDILELDSVGVRDSFLELGGNSVLAARLFSRIQNVSGQELGFSTILRLPTVEKQANLIRRIRNVSAFPLLVPIQTDGSRLPLFGIHACDGEVLFYRDLSRRLGSDQPFYAIRLHGIYGGEVPHNSIQDMARHYISEIEVVQPEGPYLLCGFGVGGRIAFEMAHQLVSQGQEVRLLALMDSAPPVTLKSDSQSSAGYYTRRLFQHIQNRQLLKTLMKRAKKPVTKVKDRFTLSPQERRMKSASAKLMKVSMAYTPQAYPGRIVYFTSAAQDNDTFPDGWRKLSDGGIDIHEVSGDHIEILREPNVQILVEQLRIYLDAPATLKT